MKTRNTFITALVCAVVVFVIPVILNCILGLNTSFTVIGDSTAWLAFWGTYLGTIVSATMAVLTWITLKETRRQAMLVERYRQEDLRPRINIDIVNENHVLWLRLRNCGKRDAYDIHLSFAENEYINYIDTEFSSLFQKTKNKQKDSFFIPLEDSVKLWIGAFVTYDIIKKLDPSLKISMSYCGGQYIESFNLRLKEFIE